MPPYIQHQLTQSHIADMHRQAEHHRIARAARRARRTDRRLSARPLHRPVTVLQHLLQTVLTGDGQRLRPAPAAPQLPSGTRRLRQGQDLKTPVMEQPAQAATIVTP
jgi:hypothetical protein